MKHYIRSYINTSLLLCALATTGCLDMGGNGRGLSPLVRASQDAINGAFSPATDQTKMWVKVKAGTKDIKVHKISNPATSLVDPTDYNIPCEITVTGSAQDYVCIAEIEELDLYFNGIDISYNIPGTTCNYTRVSPYWYFRYQVGRGAATVQEYYDNLGSAPVVTIADTEGGALRALTASETSYNNLKCPYDYTTFGGPNCCLGTFTHITMQQQAGATPPTITTTLGTPWNGDASKCVDGPGADTTYYKRHPTFRTPLPIYRNIEGSGISGDVVSASSYQRLYRTNIYNANFFNPADHGGSTPQPLDAITFTNPAEFDATPSDGYTFECLDRSSLLKHRIKLYVREWNEAIQLQMFSMGQTGTSSDTTANNVNDFKDWKDMSPGAAGGYPQNTQ